MVQWCIWFWTVFARRIKRGLTETEILRPPHLTNPPIWAARMTVPGGKSEGRKNPPPRLFHNPGGHMDPNRTAASSGYTRAFATCAGRKAGE